MSVPGASVDVIASGAALIQGDPSKVIAVMGCSSKVPTGGSKQPFPYTKASDCAVDMGCGPGVKAFAQLVSKTGSPALFVHIPATAVAATKSAVTTTRAGSSTSVITATGTPKDGYEIIFIVTTGGTIGVSGIIVKYSLDGGYSYRTGVALGTASTLVLLDPRPGTTSGITLNFAAGTLDADDEATLTTTPASQAILPLTVTKVASSTSAITATGSPEDAYEVVLEILTGGTRGTAGIVYRYSLDGGRKFTPARALGTDVDVDLLDGDEDAGVNVAFGAGDLDAGDKVEFETTPPAWQASDVTEAQGNLKASAHQWSGFWVVGGGEEVTGASADDFDDVGGVVDTWWGSGPQAKFPWFVMEARDRTYGEDVTPYTTWRGRLVDAVVDTDEYRGGFCAGLARLRCPLTERQNRRSIANIVVPRIVARDIHIDPGDVRLGAVSADVELYNDAGHLVEENANENSALHDARYITLRTIPDKSGIYVTRGNTMGALGQDFSRIAHTRLIGQTATIQRREEQTALNQPVPTNPPAPITQAPLVPGAITSAFAHRFGREMRTSLQAELGGNCQGFIVNIPVDYVFTGTGSGALKSQVQVLPYVYVDQVVGTAQFANPTVLSLQTP